MQQQILMFLILSSLIFGIPQNSINLEGNTSAIIPQTFLFNATNAYLHVHNQVDFGPRPPGSDALLRTAEYINDYLKEYKWSVTFQNFTYNAIPLHNIMAERECDEDYQGEWIIIGAHYDTRNRTDSDSNPNLRSEQVLGANDGASGVGVLLELGRVISLYNMSGIRLLFFDAEDQGNGGITGWSWIVGSNHYAESINASTVEVVVIVDMIGDENLNIHRESFSTSTLTTEIWNTALNLNVPGFYNNTKYAILDDHRPFLDKGISAVDIIDFDYWAWHTTYDNMSQVSAGSLNNVGTTLEAWLAQIRRTPVSFPLSVSFISTTGQEFTNSLIMLTMVLIPGMVILFIKLKRK